MSDEMNNITPEDGQNVSPEENVSNVSEVNTTQEEIKTEPAHTSVPNAQPYVYTQGNTYWTSDGQYRSFNQQNTQQSGYYYNNSSNGYNQNQTQNTNPYQSSYNYSGYNYQYTAPQQPQQPQRQAQPQKKKSGGKIIAIVAVCSALTIIFALCAFVVGIMLMRNGTTVPADTTTAVDGRDTEKLTPNTEKTETEETAEATSAPATTPDANINTGSSDKFMTRSEAAAKTINSVVDLVVEEVVQGAFLQEYTSVGGGSGVIITEDGYIATNNHMVENKSKITVTLRNGESYDAVVVGTDEVTDLAVIKIDAHGLQPATFGDSSKLVLAQDVIAIGNALGVLGGTVTEGIVSSLERSIIVETGQEITVLQTTAVINPGNSGGGLFNLAGECIGIVNAKAVREDTEGVGYAIPSTTVIPVLEDLMKYGYVRNRVTLGVSFVEILDNYTRRRYGVSELGLYISSVDAGSDAEKAGLQVADRIVSVNGSEISSYDEMKRIISKCSAGDTIKMVISRGGSQLTVNVTFSEYVPV